MSQTDTTIVAPTQAGVNVTVIDNTLMTVDIAAIATFADSFRQYIESQLSDVDMTAHTVAVDHYAGYAAEAWL